MAKSRLLPPENLNKNIKTLVTIFEKTIRIRKRL